MLVNKLVMGALLVSAASFFVSPASAGFDKDGNLELRVSTLKRAIEAAEKGKGFWVTDARTGSKTRLVFSETKADKNTPNDWPEDSETNQAQFINGSYHFTIVFDPHNRPADEAPPSRMQRPQYCG